MRNARCTHCTLHTVLQVCVEQGATVAEGDPLVVVEAMKMEHTGGHSVHSRRSRHSAHSVRSLRGRLEAPSTARPHFAALCLPPPSPPVRVRPPLRAVRAPCAGVVAELDCLAGSQVEDGRVLAVVVPPEAAAATA